MERFLHAQNLARYIDLLELDGDPSLRPQLRTLLLEELDWFGNRKDKLDDVDGLIATSKDRVSKQVRIVATLAEEGRDTARAQRLLSNMTSTLELIVAYHSSLHPSRLGWAGDAVTTCRN